MNLLAELLGKSPALEAVRQKVEHLVQRQTDARRLPPILILGETGTGKGLLARAIHQSGPRRNGPFVDVNCAAIPETLLEAEMFGFERGAFTDARQAKVGLFQAAHRGTIFLDEIGLLPEALQAKLLKVIEEQAVRRLGSTRSEPVDVWILAATSEDLAVVARERRFREDLYHRLAVLTLSLPPLRERGADILLLAQHFLSRASADYGLPPRRLDSAASAALEAYTWPGNIRELSNVMERVALLSEAQVVTWEMLGLPEARPAEPRGVPPRGGGIPLEEVVGNVEQTHLLEALTRTNWNISHAATRLGLSRNTLRYRIEKYGLRPGTSPREPRRRATPPPAVTPAPPTAIPETAPAPVSVRWERRRLTVLRVALLAPPGSSPPDTSRVLEDILEKLETFGGRVEELSPMGVVAVFGAEPMEDAPRRAALAAMAMLKAAERAWRVDGERLACKLAIHVSHCLVGQMGRAAQMDLEGKRQAFTVVDALTERAEPGSVLVSDAAAPFLMRRFDLVPVGPPEARSYRLWGQELAGLALGGRMARFVGRDHELGLLRSRCQSALRGQGQVVGIAGEAGIGKSRLLHEFCQSLKGERVTWIEGRCLSYGTAIPYLPMLDILRARCGIAEGDSQETLQEKVRATLGSLAMAPQERAPYLLHLLGSAEDAERLAALGPEAIKTRAFDTLCQMSVASSRHEPLIIVVEDLHWIDKTSEEFFASLAEAMGGTRILLVSTYRFGYRPPWIEKSYATQIALQPLAPEDSLAVVRSILGTDRVADTLVEVILSKAEGNPFFLEELARAVREQGHLAPAVTVPDTVQEAVLARIARLPAEEKSLLQSAAVIGRDVPLVLLKATADLPDDVLEASLVHLQAAEFLYEARSRPDAEFAFKHTLTQEVAYGSLLEDQRRLRHARIVEAIERHYPDRLAENIEHLAHHAFQGQVWEKALTYLRQAGAKAFGRSANREAVVCFEQALAALGHVPETREMIEQAIDLRFDLRNSLHLLGEFERIDTYLREAKALAEALDEQRRLGWVFSYLTQCSRLMGDLPGTIESGQRALAIAAALGDFTLQVATDTHLGPAYGAMGDYHRAIEILRRNIGALTGELSRERFRLAGIPAVISRTNLVCFLAEMGEFGEGIALGEEGIRVAEAVDDPYSLIFACFGVGTLFLIKGELPQAVTLLERGLRLCRAVNLPLMFPPIASSLGSAYALSGRLADAVPLLEQAVDQARSMKLMNRYSIFLTRLGQAYLLTDRPNEAGELAGRALEFSREHKERGHEAYVLCLLGDIAARRGSSDLENAELHYRQALTLSDQLGMRPLLAHCHLGLGTLYRHARNAAGARDHLAAAAALFGEMGMGFWCERAPRG